MTAENPENQYSNDKSANNGSGSSPKSPKQTEMLQMPESDKERAPRKPTGSTRMLEPGWQLQFRIGDSQKTINISERISIGRMVENDSGDDSVDFDLAPFGAYHYGVSRHHAVMTIKEGYLYLEDLGSTNGTRINGFQLTARQKYRLRDGDEIEFARLRMSIRFRNPGA